MLSKVLAVVQSKAALAVLGVVLVGGGGSAVAFAATTHQLPFMSSHATATAKPDATHEANDNHAHTVSIEGVLKAYSGGTITVSASNVHSNDGNGQPEATEKPEATKTATTTTMTITVNDKTKVNGENASKLADLSKNIGHKVQVQADKQSNGSLVAWKVTLQGADGHSGDDYGDNDGKGSGDGSTSVQSHVLLGKVTSVGSSSFVIQIVNGSTKTVTVNAQTQYRGGAHSLADLKANARVGVMGSTQSNGTFLAISVAVETTSN